MVDFTCAIYSYDGTMQNAPSTFRWINLLNESSVKFGKEMNIASHHKRWMINTGFTNVREVVYKVRLLYWMIRIKYDCFRSLSVPGLSTPK